MKEVECSICGAHFKWNSMRVECELKDYTESRITNQVAQETLLNNGFSPCDGCVYLTEDYHCELGSEDDESARYAEKFCYDFKQNESIIVELLESELEAAKNREKIFK